ncbi:MAG: O-antigen ligase family protein [Nitrososphaera sp.]
MRRIVFWTSVGLIFVLPWENAMRIGGLGTVSKTVGLSVAALWAAAVIIMRRLRKPHIFHILFFLFVLWNFASILWSVDIEASLQRSLTYLQLVGFALILWDLYRTGAALNTGLQAYVLGAYVAAGSIMANYIAGIDAGNQRFSVAGFNANDIAQILALGMPVAWHLAVSTTDSERIKGPVLRLINFAYLPIASFAIFLTGSRAVSFALIPIFLFVFMSLKRMRTNWRLTLGIALTAALFAQAILIPQSTYRRLANTATEITEGDLNNRMSVWREGVAIFVENPIVGIGSGAFRTGATETGKAPHNFVLSLLAELGIIGFSLFAAILIVVFYHARRQPSASSNFWSTILIVWLFSAVTHNVEYRKQTWLFLGFVITSSALYVRREHSRLLSSQQLALHEYAETHRI